MRRLVLSAIVGAAACYGEPGTEAGVPPTFRALDLGDGVVASLGSDGSFTIARDGRVIVANAPGAPLLARARDVDLPDAWHDPTKPSDLPSVAIDQASIDLASANDASSTKAIHITVGAQASDTALMTLALAADDGFFAGLGERYDHVDARGRVSAMYLTLSTAFESGTNEAHVPVPLLVSSNGWGVFVASREAGAFDVGATDASAVRATFEGRTLDVYVFVDPDPLAIVARFNRQAGLPRPMPTYALAPMHWRNHWSSSDEVISARDRVSNTKDPREHALAR